MNPTGELLNPNEPDDPEYIFPMKTLGHSTSKGRKMLKAHINSRKRGPEQRGGSNTKLDLPNRLASAPAAGPESRRVRKVTNKTVSKIERDFP